MSETDKCHVMIDLETMGTSHKAALMSIGAVVFTMQGDILGTYHMGISLQSCLDIGMEMDASTVEWWMKQSKENQDRVLSLKRTHIRDAIYGLHRVFTSISCDMSSAYIWSHGSNFDTVILMNVYKLLGMEPWWKYSHVRDTRTLFDVANYTYTAKGGHDALDDATNQAKAVVEAYQQLNQRRDASSKVQFLLDNYVEAEDGKFCFPDGDVWNTKRRA